MKCNFIPALIYAHKIPDKHGQFCSIIDNYKYERTVEVDFLLRHGTHFVGHFNLCRGGGFGAFGVNRYVCFMNDICDVDISAVAFTESAEISIVLVKSKRHVGFNCSDIFNEQSNENIGM